MPYSSYGRFKMKNHSNAGHMMTGKYLALMAALSFLAMYILMYMMVDTVANVYPNLNQFYMAGLMTSPMVAIELLVMGSMYKNRRLKKIVIGLSLAALALLAFLIRAQFAVTDREFLKSMIPHHGGAVLMAKKAALQDPEIKALARSIIASQQSEIDWMKAKLRELKNKRGD